MINLRRNALEAKTRLMQRQRASDELRKVTTRAVVYKLLLIGPTLFMGAIGVQSRLATETFQATQCSPAQQKAITAYVEPVRMAVELYNKHQGDPKQARLIAADWVSQAEKGELEPLPPISYSDSLNEGVKNQIKVASDGVITNLEASARREIKAKNYDLAAKDLLLGIQFSEILKYSDFGAVNAISMRQRGFVNKLAHLATRIKPETRQDVKATLASVQTGEQAIRNLGSVYLRNLSIELQEEAARDQEASTHYAFDAGQTQVVEPQLRRAQHAQQSLLTAIHQLVTKLSNKSA